MHSLYFVKSLLLFQLFLLYTALPVLVFTSPRLRKLLQTDRHYHNTTIGRHQWKGVNCSSAKNIDIKNRKHLSLYIEKNLQYLVILRQ